MFAYFKLSVDMLYQVSARSTILSTNTQQLILDKKKQVHSLQVIMQWYITTLCRWSCNGTLPLCCKDVRLMFALISDGNKNLNTCHKTHFYLRPVYVTKLNLFLTDIRSYHYTKVFNYIVKLLSIQDCYTTIRNCLFFGNFKQ